MSVDTLCVDLAIISRHRVGQMASAGLHGLDSAGLHCVGGAAAAEAVRAVPVELGGPFEVGGRLTDVASECELVVVREEQRVGVVGYAQFFIDDRVELLHWRVMFGVGLCASLGFVPVAVVVPLVRKRVQLEVFSRQSLKVAVRMPCERLLLAEGSVCRQGHASP